MYIVISAGHGLEDPGCVNEALGLTEHLICYQIAWALRDCLIAAGHYAEFVSCFQSLSGKIAMVNDLHALVPVDCAIELHLNSHTTPDAHGTEVCYASSAQEPLAAQMSAALAQELAITDRGAKHRPDLAWLTQTVPPALLAEVLFLSNPDEAALTQVPGFHTQVAAAISQALLSPVT